MDHGRFDGQKVRQFPNDYENKNVIGVKRSPRTFCMLPFVLFPCPGIDILFPANLAMSFREMIS